MVGIVDGNENRFSSNFQSRVSSMEIMTDCHVAHNLYLLNMQNGEGNGKPLQCSCLENPRDGGTWWAAVSGVTQSRIRLKRLSSIVLIERVRRLSWKWEAQASLYPLGT